MEQSSDRPFTLDTVTPVHGQLPSPFIMYIICFIALILFRIFFKNFLHHLTAFYLPFLLGL